MDSRLASLRRLIRSPFKQVAQIGDGIRKTLHYRRLGWRADLSHESPNGSVRSTANSPEHIAIVIIDALRPSSLPLPNLGFKATTAIAPSTWTFPSVTSLLTGRLPHQHGAVAHTVSSDEKFAIPTQTTTVERLPELFEVAGYETFGAFAFSMPFLATKGWFQTHRVYSDANADRVLEAYEKWREGRERTYAYLHLGDLHAPLCPPESYVVAHDVDTDLPGLEHIAAYTTDYTGTEQQRYYRSQKLALYQAGLNYVTAEIKSTFDPLLDDTLVVVTGDHGEALYEHADIDRRFTDSRPNYGVGHGGTPLDQVARVPIALSEPELLPTGGWASLCDLPVTLTDVCLDANAFGQAGVSWHESIPTDRAAICEGVRYGVERKAAYRGNRKLVYSRADDVAYIARVTPEDDDEEILSTTAGADDLRACLPDSWDDIDATQANEKVNAEIEEQLRFLGYR